MKNSNNTRIRFLTLVILLSLTVILAACGSQKSDTLHVQGQLKMANSGPLPKDASARISLVQHVGDKGHIVVEQTLHDLGTPPVKFDLSVGRGLLAQSGQYGLNAEILDAKGNISWQTPVAQSAQPLDGKSASYLLMLQRVADTQDIKFQHYACADKFTFGAARQDKQALVHLGRRQITLTPQKAKRKNAAAYSDDHQNLLVFGNGSVELTVDGASHLDCHEAPVQADKPDKSDEPQQAAGEKSLDQSQSAGESGQAGNPDAKAPGAGQDSGSDKEAAKTGSK